MKKIRWGIISTAKIGTEKVIPAMQRGTYCEVTAIASRDLSRAQQAARKLGIPKSYGSYDELLADPDIDAVYNPLPNHLHVPVSIQAMRAGKHVLCEKPIALSVQEAQELVDAARAFPHLKVMEAFMYRHHPQWQKARELVRDGTDRHAADDPVVLLVLQRRSPEHPQRCHHRRWRPDGYRLLPDLAVALHL